MESTSIFAIAVGGLLITCVFVNFVSQFSGVPRGSKPFLARLRYPYVIRRHGVLEPWTLLDLLLQSSYTIVNFYCLGLQDGLAKVGHRAGTLSLINLIPLFLGPQLNFLADVLGLTLATFQSAHRCTGLMAVGMAILHTIITIFGSSNFALRSLLNMSGVLVRFSHKMLDLLTCSSAGSSLLLNIVLLWRPFRRYLYQLYIRIHQALAAVTVVSALLHTSSSALTRLYIYISLGIFATTSLAEAGIALQHNVRFSWAWPRLESRVGEVFKYHAETGHSPIQLTILPKKPLVLQAGQYINVCIPSLGLRYITESHPFVVASWMGRQQRKLELIIKPRRGWTRRLSSRAVSVSGQSGGLGRVLFTGPHGIPIPVDKYDHIFMIASDYGIIAHLPILERLVQGTLAHEVRARRIRLVWEFEDLELYKTVYPALNRALAEDRHLGRDCVQTPTPARTMLISLDSCHFTLLATTSCRQP